MKQIIDGKRYDTESATIIAEASSDCGYSDFNHWEEKLYRTKSGNWFLAGAGGPMSRYAQSTGQNSWSGGSRITPLTPEEARDWCEQYDQLALEKHFAETIQDA